MLKKKINHQKTALRVCVDVIQNGQISGRVYCPCLNCTGDELAFTDVTDFFLQMEAMFDRLDFPQSFQRIRSFAEDERPASASMAQSEVQSEEAADQNEDVMERQGMAFTFTVNVIARQNATWQGYVDWLDDGPRQSFRSALELIRLMAQALSRQTSEGKQE